MKLRLALREEGNFWNAYMAKPDTMDDAKLIGSIIIGAPKQNPEIRAVFQALMQQVFASAIKQVTGKVPTEWTTEPAPEAERSGHA